MNIRIGNFEVGDNCPVFIVAEISGNHGGVLDNALKLVHSAKIAGANAIKLQTFKPETITLNSDKPDFLLPQNSPWANHGSLWKLYAEAYTPWEWHEPIFNEAKKLGLEYFSSPFDDTAVNFLESLGVPAYKIASPEIVDIPLLERVGKTGKPVIISTGVADYSDIKLAVETLKLFGSDEIIILKCNSSYPAPLSEANLKTISDYRKSFGVLAGLSDHTLGNLCPVVAVALGASLIEKHITDVAVSSVDSFFSTNEVEFKSMVESIRDAEVALGKVSYEIEESAFTSLRGRKSIYVSQKIEKGECFSSENVKSVRPSFSLHPKFYKKIIGKKSKKTLYPGDRISFDVVEL
jgi:pseudaminic acid synthase